MSDKVSNLKIRFSAETKQFRKGIEQTNASMKKMQQQGKQSFSRLSGAISQQTGLMNGQFSQIAGGLRILGTGFKGAATGGNILSKAMRILKLALVSTGIGALVVALGSVFLYFTKTSEGAYKLKTAIAVINQIISIFVDKLVEMGKGVVNLFGNIGSLLKSVFTGDFAKAKETAAKIIDNFKSIDLGKEYDDLIKQIKEKGAAALRIQRELNDLDKREIEATKTNAEKKAKIAELVAESQKKDKKTAAERKQLVLQALALQKQVNAENIAIEKEKVRLMKEQQALGNNTIQDNKDLAAEIKKLNEVKATAANLERTLYNRINKTNSEIDRQIGLVLNSRRANEVKNADNVSLQDLATPLNSPKITAPTFDTSGLDEVEKRMNAFQQFSTQSSQAISSAFKEIGKSFFESVGQMAAGADNMSNFGDTLLVGLANLAVKVGEIALGIGTALLATQESLSTLNPWVAIAAGTALIALGSFAKGYLKELGNTGGGGGSFAGSAANTNTITQPNIQITGELTASGNSLKLVLDKENFRVKQNT